jgi:hypothetical protein
MSKQLKFKEELPEDCPFPDSQDVALEDVWRFLEGAEVTPGCFDSYSKKGKPVHPSATPCQWSSCSLFIGDSYSAAALKLPRFKKFLARALLSVPSGSGRSYIKEKHVDFWAFEHFDFFGDQKIRRIRGRLDAVLFETDVADIALLSRKQGTGVQHFLACAIPDTDGFVDHYLAVFVVRAHLDKYFNEQCDLRFLFTYAGGKKFYRIDKLVHADRGMTILEEFQGEVTEAMLPDGRFFASAHTSNYGLNDIASGEQRLLIDGNWDMQEFGTFYQKFSDLYSYEQAIKYVVEGVSSKTTGVYTAFRTKPFKGGSSYVGFFSDLIGLIPFRERPALDGIVYHSPGHVDLRGEDTILDGVQESIQAFLNDLEAIMNAHDNLKGFMSKSGLLKVTGRSASPSNEVLNTLRELSSNFFAVLPIRGKTELMELTDGNLVVRAKIGLALYRRLRTTSQFFAQGRLSFDA